MHVCMYVQWRIQEGANPAMAPPPLKLSMEFGPPRGRKSNDSIVNLSKCKDLGPPYRCHLRKNTTLKRSTQKKNKIIRNFGSQMTFLEEMQKFFRERPEKGR